MVAIKDLQLKNDKGWKEAGGSPTVDGEGFCHALASLPDEGITVLRDKMETFHGRLKLRIIES